MGYMPMQLFYLHTIPALLLNGHIFLLQDYTRPPSEQLRMGHRLRGQRPTHRSMDYIPRPLRMCRAMDGRWDITSLGATIYMEDNNNLYHRRYMRQRQHQE